MIAIGVLALMAAPAQADHLRTFNDFPVEQLVLEEFGRSRGEPLGATLRPLSNIIRPFTECVRSGTLAYRVADTDRGNLSAARAFVSLQAAACGCSAVTSRVLSLLLQDNSLSEMQAEQTAVALVNMSVVSGAGAVPDRFGLVPVFRGTIPCPLEPRASCSQPPEQNEANAQDQ